MSDRLIKLACLELQHLDSSQIIKIAGIVQRLKNWFKYQTNIEFKQIVDNLKNQSGHIKEVLTELTKEIDNFNQSIASGDLDAYESSVKQLKSLTKDLWKDVVDVSENSKNYYTLQDLEQPGFLDWFKKHLPSDYDLELGKTYNVPVTEFKWYKNLTSDQISLSNKSLLILLTQIKRALKLSEEDTKKYLQNEELIKNLFLNSIINGKLLQTNIKKPSQEIGQQVLGSTEIEILTAPFTLPNSNFTLQAKVDLIDLKTSVIPRNKLSVRKIHFITVLSTKNAFANNPLPYKVTQISELDFAKILREAYQKTFGTDPTMEVLAYGWAQGVLESGRPIKLPNNNVGNLKASKDWIKNGKPYFVKSTSEFTSSGKPFIDTNAAWQAFNTPVEGAIGYWRYLQRKHPEALQWMASGEPDSATVSLAKNHYFTANIQKYAKSVNSLYQEFMTKLSPQLPNLISNPQTPPGEKPEIKNWVNEYSSPPSTNQQIDQLLTNLYASDGKLTSLIKESVYKQVLPESSILISVNGSNLSDKIYWAYVTSHILQETIQAKTQIHHNQDQVELQVMASGFPLTVGKAVQAIADSVSTISELYIQPITGIAAINCVSQLPILSSNNLFKFQRQFFLKQAVK